MSEIRIASGARATERALLDAVLALFAPGAALDPAPVRIIVPSRSLREHVLARLAARAGRPLLGLRVQTLYGAAVELLTRADVPPGPSGDAFFSILVDRSLRERETLELSLARFEEAASAPTATVADLLDSGLEPHLAPAIDERLAALGDGTAVRRARALVEVALDVQRTLRKLGAVRSGDVLADAARQLQTAGAAALPARALFVHGFADATGRASDLLEALVRVRDACVFLEDPPDPSAASADFTQRLRERLGLAETRVQDEGVGTTPPPTLVRAGGAYAEAREVASRVHALLGDGVAPESVAIVCRDLGGFALPLRTELRRLGLPFSGHKQAGGPVLSVGRRLRALVELLRERESTDVDGWLDLIGGTRELSVALHALGAMRLGDVAALDPRAVLSGKRALRLPVRGGLDENDRGEGRSLPADTLVRHVRRARDVFRRLERWPESATARRHVTALRGLAGALGFPPGEGEPLADGIERVCAALDDALPSSLALTRDEIVGPLAAIVDGEGRDELGGRGGGVQVLDVTEARGRTFEHLFAIGLNRSVFPRAVREDALLPDASRRPLSELLPELPIKQRGHAEEAYLFAQLAAAASHLTLSWQELDDEGVPLAPSSFIERVLRANPGIDVARASALWEDDARTPRPLFEHAVLAGLDPATDDFEPALGLALEDPTVARARTAALAELDAVDPTRPPLGPFLGHVGRGAAPLDSLYITALERFATCPWQTFLRRVLRIEPLPDALDELPGPNPRVTGNLVHAVLEQIFARQGVPTGVAFGELQRLAPSPVRWPEPAELEDILHTCADETLQREGFALAAVRVLLVEAARPLVETARRRLWPIEDEALLLAGSEVTGSFEHGTGGGAPLRIHFRADLIEVDQGQLRLTDVKTGKPISDLVRPENRAAKFAESAGNGTTLQIPAYQRGGGKDATARYLFVKPEIPDDRAEFALGPEDTDVLERADAAMTTLANGWEAGLFFPRLVDAEKGTEPRMCTYCEVAEACLRRDAPARARVSRLAQDGGPDPLAQELFTLGQEEEPERRR